MSIAISSVVGTIPMIVATDTDMDAATDEDFMMKKVREFTDSIPVLDLQIDEKTVSDLENASSIVVFDPPSSPRTLEVSVDGNEEDDEASTSSKRRKIDPDCWVPIQIDMSESNSDWWRTHWPAYKGPEKQFDVSSIFDPLHSVFSSAPGQSDEPTAFNLPFGIRHLVAGVTTGKDGEYIGPSATTGRSGRRHRIINKVIPEPPKPPQQKQKSKKKAKSSSGSGTKSSASTNDDWEALSDLTSLSEISDSEDHLLMDDDSDAESVLTTLSELEEEIARKPYQPKLIGRLPIATPEELNYFEPLANNVLPTRNSGLAGFMEGQRRCFCGDGSRLLDNPKLACREASRCINRFMNVECPPMECGAGESCGNQRIQKEEFAAVAVIATKRKGFGLRAEGGIAEGNLVCEYTGEVVNGQQAEKRLRKYMKKRSKHIYMMELQKGEYIDATVKGGVARFANHSCNPNCEIQQWVVGEWLRMVLVAKRDIIAHEEITFNYNMNFMGDSKVQKCFCREKGCSGFIGRAHVARTGKKEPEKLVPFSPPAVSLPSHPPIVLHNKENRPPPPRRNEALSVESAKPKAEEKPDSSTARVLRSRSCKG